MWFKIKSIHEKYINLQKIIEHINLYKVLKETLQAFEEYAKELSNHTTHEHQ